MSLWSELTGRLVPLLSLLSLSSASHAHCYNLPLVSYHHDTATAAADDDDDDDAVRHQPTLSIILHVLCQLVYECGGGPSDVDDLHTQPADNGAADTDRPAGRPGGGESDGHLLYRVWPGQPTMLAVPFNFIYC